MKKERYATIQSLSNCTRLLYAFSIHQTETWMGDNQVQEKPKILGSTPAPTQSKIHVLTIDE